MKITFEGSLDQIVSDIRDFMYVTSETVREPASHGCSRLEENEIEEFVISDTPEEAEDAIEAPEEIAKVLEPEATVEEEVIEGMKEAVEHVKVEAPEPAKKSRRRGPAPKVEAKPQTEEAVEEPVKSEPEGKEKSNGKVFTDADMAKAASAAAQAITPPAVKEILGQFGVAFTGQLDQGQRAEFIDLLDAAVTHSEAA